MMDQRLRIELCRVIPMVGVSSDCDWDMRPVCLMIQDQSFSMPSLSIMVLSKKGLARLGEIAKHAT